MSVKAIVESAYRMQTASPALQPVHRSVTLSQQAYDRIREGLLTGSLPVDRRLVAGDLAEQLSMSRTPVRDALQRLAVSGLLLSAGGSGYVVALPNRRDLRDLYELRALLEPQAAQLLAGRPAADRGAFLEQIENAETAGGTAAQRGHALHVAIARHAGNPYLGEAVQWLNERLVPRRASVSGRLPDAGRGHGEVLDAIRRGEPGAAAAALRAHLLAAAEAAEDVEEAH
jgi:DNA-binding GntR family transcriptional regulator